MNKKIFSFAILVSLFCLASIALGGITDPLNGATFSTILGRIVDEVGKLIATLGTTMIIVAGILYLTSAGSPERVGTAKKALMYAIAGIAIGLAASSIAEIIENIVGA